MKKKLTLLYALLLALTLILSGCQGDVGPAGTPGADGTDGTGSVGPQGPVGQTGTTGTLPSDPFQVANFHGKAYTAEGTRGPSNTANPWLCITGASVTAVGNLQVDFKALSSKGADGVCGGADDVLYTTSIPSSAARFGIAQFIPESGGDSSYWVNYINATKRKQAGYGFANNTGLELNQPTTETGNTTGGTWTNNGDGTYRYVTKEVLTGGETISVGPKAGSYSYDENKTHRVAIQLGDPDGAGAATMGANNPIYDFIPVTGTAVADPREIVVVGNCNECHGTLGLHGGGRIDTKFCVVCHNATAGDPESGNTIDFKVMIHKIHMGKYLPSVKFDYAGDSAGSYRDLSHSTATTTDDPEAAVKGTPYKIWGHVVNGVPTEFDFSEIAFPANPANCLKCHKTAANGGNWKTKPTKEACGSCHDGIDFATGTGRRVKFPAGKMSNTTTINHVGGIQANSDCINCHQSSGTQTTKDQTDTAPIPYMHGDFGASVANGWSKVQTDYTVTLTMSSPATGTYYSAGDKPIVTIVINDAATGLPIDHTTVTEANIGTANLYVYGPTALKKPVLTTSALLPTFAVSTSVNKNSIDVQGGTRRVVPISTASNKLMAMTVQTSKPYQDDYQMVNGVADLTKLTGVISRADTAKIQYQLGDVTGLTSGTYKVFIQLLKKNSLKTISIASTTFQVGTATAEKKIAICTACHESTLWHDTPGATQGNHPAYFDPDLCAACHDYAATQPSRYGTPNAQSLLWTSKPTTWKGGTPSANNLGFGAAPIARRVHGVHFGKRADGTAGVTYPFEIYNNHNVAITFPQDVRNCDSTCHTSATGGTWKTNPSRVACLACHDSDATTAHGTLQTVDPTPTVTTSYDWTAGAGPYGGGEQESCAVCHKP